MTSPAGSLLGHVDVRHVILMFLAGFAAYGSVLSTYFVSDDFNLIAAVVRGGPFGMWTEANSPFFRPVISLSFYVDHLVWGLNPFGYHLTNLGLHALSASMCGWIVSLIATGAGEAPRRGEAALIGACFLLAPNHAETVTWIAGRSDVISTFFVLGSVVSYLLVAVHGPSRGRIGACLALFACALLSKESSMALPVIVAVHAFAAGRRTVPRRNLLWLGAGLGVVAAVYIVVRALIIGQLIGGYGAETHLDVFNASVPGNLATFMSRSLLPPGLSIDYVLAGYVIWAGLAMLALWPGLRRRPIAILAALALAAQFSLIPILNFVVSITNSSSERFLYLSSAFVTTLAGAACVAAARRLERFRVLPLVAVFVFYTFHLRRVNEPWIEAAGITSSVIRSLESVRTGQKVLVLNVPANINGAFIFQAGFWDAVELLDQVEIDLATEPIVHHAIAQVTDRVSAARVGQAFDVRFLDSGMWIEYTTGDVMTVVSEEGKRVSIEGPLLTAGVGKVLYYSAGAMHELK